MAPEANEILQAWKPLGPSHAPPAKPGRGGSGADLFESLLGRLAQKAKNLENQTAGKAGCLEGEAISKPEDLEAALREAGRNYRSCMALGKKLVEAYQTTLARSSGPR